MSERRQTLVQRVAQALLDLELLSQGRTAGAAAAKSLRTAASAVIPAGPAPELDRLIHDLEHWLRRAETITARAHRGPDATTESPARFQARVLTEHAGRHYTEVAELENVSTSYIRKIRTDAGVSPLDGT